jgi:hypothetical protein
MATNAERRKEMDRALREIVLPVLRAAGFTGSLPHLRRARGKRLDLLTFQFDKWGGGFVVEAASAGNEVFTTHWGAGIAPGKLTAHDLDPSRRLRIQPGVGGGVDAWFRFDTGNCAEVARVTLELVDRSEAWWQEREIEK